jgi:hypothetical protein
MGRYRFPSTTSLISRPMQCPVIAAAKWHRELVTYSASHGAVLCKSDLMSLSRTTAADQTRVGRHVFRGAGKFFRCGLILAALFCETVQSSAVQVFGGCLIAAPNVGKNYRNRLHLHPPNLRLLHEHTQRLWDDNAGKLGLPTHRSRPLKRYYPSRCHPMLQSRGGQVPAKRTR